MQGNRCWRRGLIARGFPEKIMECRVCGNAKDSKVYTIREMLFGTKQEFEYFQCANCGCLQIAEIPEDMSRHYPSDYPSFELKRGNYEPALRRVFRRIRDRCAFLGPGPVSSFLHKFCRYPALHSVSLLKLSKDARILDVGCGGGAVLGSLSDLGFTNLIGVDPYVDSDINYPSGVRVLKKSIFDIEGVFDLVTFHHVFEHVPDPAAYLDAAAGVLDSGGFCLIRIPVVDCWAWEEYGVHWYAIDAPRHLYLHSKKSMDLLAKNAGFKIIRIEYDSAFNQFWLSECYKNDMSWYEEKDGKRVRRKPDCSWLQMRRYKKQSEQLNREGRGDTAAFYLEKL